MGRVSKITIRRFKQLEEVTVELGNTTLLVGANNSGKSSILQAIHFAVSLAQTAKLVGRGVSWARDSFELSYNPSQLLYSPVADVLSLAHGGALQESRETRIEVEFHTEAGDKCVVGVRRGRNRNLAVQLEGRTLGEQLMNFEAPYTIYAPGLAGIPREEPYQSPGVVRRIVARGDANLVLRNVLLMLSKNSGRWHRFVQDMRVLFPGINIAVSFDHDIDEYIRALFQLPNGPELPLDAAGTSVLQASQILAYVHLFAPRLLLLDEPDSHLHPDNQRRFLKAISDLAEEHNFQVLISTHSRHVLDVLKERANVLWLSKGKLQDKDVGTNITSVLLDLGALDSTEYLNTKRCVVTTEDSDTKALKALLESNGFDLEETLIKSYSGCSKLEAAQVLAGFISENAKEVRLVVHRDRDYLSDSEVDSFRAGFSGKHYAFVTKYTDIESYFLNPFHLAALNPRLSVERIAELLEQATIETAKKSKEIMVNFRTEQAYRRGRPNHGQIALEAFNDYDRDPVKYRRGKIVLSHLRSLLQRELRSNPRIFEPSCHLLEPDLLRIALEIWPIQARKVGERNGYKALANVLGWRLRTAAHR